MTAQVSAFRWVPPFAQGFVRDLRVRWALEEAGFPYEAVLLDFETKNSADYRAWQPFAQVPAYRDDEVEMFESGAIVLHIARKSEALAPRDAAGRARVESWIFAALNSVEPAVSNFSGLDVFHTGAPWVDAYRPVAEEAVTERLTALAAWLGDKPHLEGRFTAADILMTTVLRELVESGMLVRFPTLDAYRARCEARPAFGRALEAQLSTFRNNAPEPSAAAQ
ncbi:MAG: glutathione S-transferase family protein [Caulobacteraceae bacterium]